MPDAIVEIRDYTIEVEWFEAYRRWAQRLAAPWLKANLDVIDFWVDDGFEAAVSGSAPFESPNGQPNVCWIIRWPSRTSRDEGYAAFAENPEWRECQPQSHGPNEKHSADRHPTGTAPFPAPSDHLPPHTQQQSGVSPPR